MSIDYRQPAHRTEHQGKAPVHEQGAASPRTAVDPAAKEATAPASQARAITPAVDILEDESGITLLADMPGVSRDDLVLQLEGDVLSIEGEAKIDVPANLVPLYDELPGRRFARSFTLSRELDPAGVKAEIQRGVLRLHIPKSEASKPRKIEVALG